MTGIQEIKARYDAGEREIRVSPQVFGEYFDGLHVHYRVVSHVNGDDEKGWWLAYKAARVIRDESLAS